VDARLDLLPAQPNLPGRGLRVAVAIDDQSPLVLTAGTEVGSKAWAQSVLDERVTACTRLQAPAAGAHVLHVFMVDPGVLLDKIVLHVGPSESQEPGARVPKTPPPGYFGPPETRVPQ
jgi:hypothetical protein